MRVSGEINQPTPTEQFTRIFHDLNELYRYMQAQGSAYDQSVRTEATNHVDAVVNRIDSLKAELAKTLRGTQKTQQEEVDTRLSMAKGGVKRALAIFTARPVNIKGVQDELTWSLRYIREALTVVETVAQQEQAVANKLHPEVAEKRHQGDRAVERRNHISAAIGFLSLTIKSAKAANFDPDAVRRYLQSAQRDLEFVMALANKDERLLDSIKNNIYANTIYDVNIVINTLLDNKLQPEVILESVELAMRKLSVAHAIDEDIVRNVERDLAIRIDKAA
jgi:hypothetical protein